MQRGNKGSLSEVLVPLLGGWLFVLAAVYYVFIRNIENMEWFVAQSAAVKVISLVVLAAPMLAAGSLLTALAMFYVLDYLQSRKQKVMKDE